MISTFYDVSTGFTSLHPERWKSFEKICLVRGRSADHLQKESADVVCDSSFNYTF
jgi:hypothetical protein